MAGNETKIEWTRFTINPWEGCFEVSPGCDNCYARISNKRFHGGRHWGATGPRRLVMNWKAKLRMAQRVAIKEGRKVTVFVSSISDIFEKEQPLEGAGTTTNDIRMEFFKLVKNTPECTFLLLTKRPQNIRKLVPRGWLEHCPENVWFGASVVNQEEADRSAPWLWNSPGTGNKFLSIEPMLDWIDLRYALGIDDGFGNINPNLNPAIRWTIVGGESGTKGKARPIRPEWIKQVKDACDAAGIDFFFKQWGNHTPIFFESGSGHVTAMVYNKNPHHKDLPFGSGILYQGYPQSMTAPL